MVRCSGEEIYTMCYRRDCAGELKKYLDENPDADVNWVNPLGGYTAIFMACGRNTDEMLQILLARKNINVNVKRETGSTPLIHACEMNCKFAICLALAKDPRVMLNERTPDGKTALYWSAWRGDVMSVKWMIARCDDLYLGDPKEKTCAIKITNTKYSGTDKEEKDQRKIWSLLKRYKKDPRQTQHCVRVELGLTDALAANLYACVIFHSDGLLEVNETRRGWDESFAKSAHFFDLASQLPMELQMILCNMVYGKMKDGVALKDSEEAFKYYAKANWW